MCSRSGSTFNMCFAASDVLVPGRRVGELRTAQQHRTRWVASRRRATSTATPPRPPPTTYSPPSWNTGAVSDSFPPGQPDQSSRPPASVPQRHVHLAGGCRSQPAAAPLSEAPCPGADRYGGCVASQFFADEQCDYDIGSSLGATYRQGACPGEVLATAARIVDGDADSWFTQWTQLAHTVRGYADTSAPNTRLCATAAGQ